MSRGSNPTLGCRHTSGGCVVELELEDVVEVFVFVDVVLVAVLVVVKVCVVVVFDDVVEVLVVRVVSVLVVVFVAVELLVVLVLVDVIVVVVTVVVVIVVVVTVVLVAVVDVVVVVALQSAPPETMFSLAGTFVAERSWMWQPPSGYHTKLVHPSEFEQRVWQSSASMVSVLLWPGMSRLS